MKRGFIQLAIEEDDSVSIRGLFSDKEALRFIKAILLERPDVGRYINDKTEKENHD